MAVREPTVTTVAPVCVGVAPRISEDVIGSPSAGSDIVVIEIHGAKLKRRRLHISDASPETPAEVLKHRVVEELSVAAGAPKVQPDFVELFIGDAHARDDLHSDLARRPPNVLCIRAVVWYDRQQPEIDFSILGASSPGFPAAVKDSPLEIQKTAPDPCAAAQPPLRLSKAPMLRAKAPLPLPPILLVSSQGTCELATEQEAQGLQVGELIKIHVDATIYYGLHGRKRSCTIPVSPQTTVLQVKERLVEWMGLCPKEFLITLHCAPLSNDKILLSYGRSSSRITALAWYEALNDLSDDAAGA